MLAHKTSDTFYEQKVCSDDRAKYTIHGTLTNYPGAVDGVSPESSFLYQLRNQFNKLVDGTQGMDERYELRIHCGVALTLYLREHWKGPQKNIYLGYSKLSCIASYCFLQGIRETTEIKFMTKGCHQKRYFPWGFPQQQSHCLRVAVYTAVGNALGSDICSWFGISANILRFLSYQC